MHGYDLSTPSTLAECHETDRAALAVGPVARYNGSFVFLRYPDVSRLLAHHDLIMGFSELKEQFSQGFVHDWLDNFMLTADAPRHARLRSLVGRAFAVRPVERMRGVARKAVEEALDRLLPRGDFDVFEDFASHIPLRVVCSMLGVPERYLDDLRRWIDDLGTALLGADVTAEQGRQAERAIEQLYALSDEIIGEKHLHPQEDLISALAIAEQRGAMSHAELQAMIAGLLLAGSDTSKTLIGLSLYLLAQHPDQFEELRRDPDLAESAVEEILRFTSPSPWTSRIATQRVECAGIVLEPGTSFVLSLAAANLDPACFSEPQRFDIRREREPHLALGRGAHFCLGAALVRLEAQEVLRALADRAVQLTSTGDTARWIRSGGLIQPLEPVRLRADS